MPTNYVNAGGSWRSLSKIFANVGGTWKAVVKGFANVAGTWKQFFGGLEIESRVEISASPTSWGDSQTGPTLTGKYYHWDDTAGMVDLTYIFQKSTVASNDDASWTDIGTPQIITTNPQASTFGTKTYVIPESDFSSSITTMYYRFVVYATSGSLSNSSKSTYLTMNYTLPIGQAGSVQFARSANTGYVYSVSNTGTWSNSPNSYLYQWQWLNTATSTWTNISGATASSYTVPSTYWTKYIRPRIYAQNSVGTSNYPIYPTEPLLVYYKTPTIGSFSVTGGVTYVSYSYTFSADDPDRVLTISYTGTSSGSFTPNLANGTYSLPAGTYSFTLKVQNTVNGNGLYAESTVSNVTVTGISVPSAPTIGTVTRTNDTTVSIPFSAPSSNGGATITSYVATSNPSRSLSVSGTTSPLSVSGSFVLDTGYTFQIAAVNSAGTGSYSSSSNSVIVNQTPPVYTITYYGNTSDGGTVSSGTYTQGGTAYTIAANGFTKTNYTFVNWNTEANGTGTTYSPGASYSTNANLSLYAQWTIAQYTVTWNVSINGGTGGGSTTQNAGVAHTAPSPGTKDGYAFSGYYNTPSGDYTYGPIQSGGSFTPPSSITMYTRWNASSPSGGTASISGTAASGSTLTLSTTDPNAGQPVTSTSITWQRNSGSSGAWVTAQNYGTSYVLGSADLSYNMRVTIVWSNAYGSQTIITNEIGPIGLPDLTGLDVKSYTSGSLSLTWNSVYGAGSYAVTIAGPNGISTSTTSTSYSRSGLISGTSYFVQVVPYSGTSGNGISGNGQSVSNKYPNGSDAAAPFFPFFPPFFPFFPPFFPFFPPFFPYFESACPPGYTYGIVCCGGLCSDPGCFPDDFSC